MVMKSPSLLSLSQQGIAYILPESDANKFGCIPTLIGAHPVLPSRAFTSDPLKVNDFSETDQKKKKKKNKSPTNPKLLTTTTFLLFHDKDEQRNSIPMLHGAKLTPCGFPVRNAGPQTEYPANRVGLNDLCRPTVLQRESGILCIDSRGLKAPTPVPLGDSWILCCCIVPAFPPMISKKHEKARG